MRLSGKTTLMLSLMVLIALVQLLFPSGYYFRVGSLVFIFALAAVGLNILMGFAGQVSLGHAGFFGLGAYAMALGPKFFALNSGVALLLGAVASGLLAFVVGRPILRLKGHYLAVGTLGFGLLIALTLTNEQAITGGPDGMAVARFKIGEFILLGPELFYWVTGFALLIGVYGALSLLESPTGRALRAIHDSEIAARVAGIDVAKYKLRAFVISAVYASVAGSLFALLNGHITPDSAGFLKSVELVTMVVLGGMGSVVGAIVGATILVVLPQALTVFHDYEHMMLGAIMMGCMIFLREGVVPSLIKLREKTNA